MPLLRRQLLPLPRLLLVPGTLGGCKSAGIREVYTSRDAAGRLRTQYFADDKTEIHVIIQMVSGREDAVLYVDLFVPEGSQAKLDRVEIAPGKGDHRIDLRLIMEDELHGTKDDDGPWPTGKYEVDLLIDAEYQETVVFYVGEV